MDIACHNLGTSDSYTFGGSTRFFADLPTNHVKDYDGVASRWVVYVVPRHARHQLTCSLADGLLATVP